jgi:hypothetical protein
MAGGVHRPDYYIRNREMIREYYKEYNKKHKERKQALEKIRRVRDKERQRVVRAAHREKNKEKIREQCRQWHLRHKQWYDDIKSKLKCEKCGESESVCLDFHHLNPKEKDKGVNCIRNRHNKEKALAEMAKCIVLCSNCHKKLHKSMRDAEKTAREAA